MEAFEEAEIRVAFIFWSYGMDGLHIFYGISTPSMHSNAKFTMKIEKDGSLRLLDVKLERDNDILCCRVYRKTMTDRQIPPR